MKRLILSLVLTAAAQGAVVPVRLSRPVYPPIAASARVSGEVEVNVRVRSDGTVESAVIASGPSLLQQAALNAAQQSQFECRGCSGAPTPYSLVFAFRLDGATQSEADEEQRGAVSVTPSQSRMTIVAESPRLHILFSNVQARSAKCLYLWRCGSRWGGYDVYYTPVRSPTCLWLWKCGFRRRE